MTAISIYLAFRQNRNALTSMDGRRDDTDAINPLSGWPGPLRYADQITIHSSIDHTCLLTTQWFRMPTSL